MNSNELKWNMFRLDLNWEQICFIERSLNVVSIDGKWRFAARVESIRDPLISRHVANSGARVTIDDSSDRPQNRYPNGIKSHLYSSDCYQIIYCKYPYSTALENVQ